MPRDRVGRLFELTSKTIARLEEEVDHVIQLVSGLRARNRHGLKTIESETHGRKQHEHERRLRP
jgi:hypothetical protein